MRAIDKKLWRELWGMRLQALAIAMVIVSGVGIFIMSLSTLDSLYETRATYYREHHFAEVFAGLKRAPLSLVKRIEEGDPPPPGSLVNCEACLKHCGKEYCIIEHTTLGGESRDIYFGGHPCRSRWHLQT